MSSIFNPYLAHSLAWGYEDAPIALKRLISTLHFNIYLGKIPLINQKVAI